MSQNNVVKFAGKPVVDAKDIAEYLVDILGGDTQTYKREKPGIAEVLDELPGAVALYGEEARLHPGIMAGIQEKTQILGKIRALLPAVAKLHECLAESEIYYEDAREGEIARICSSVKDVARFEEKPALVAAFEKTIKYRAQYAEKGRATRMRNEMAQNNEEVTTRTEG